MIYAAPVATDGQRPTSSNQDDVKNESVATSAKQVPAHTGHDHRLVGPECRAAAGACCEKSCMGEGKWNAKDTSTEHKVHLK